MVAARRARCPASTAAGRASSTAHCAELRRPDQAGRGQRRPPVERRRRRAPARRHRRRRRARSPTTTPPSQRARTAAASAALATTAAPVTAPCPRPVVAVAVWAATAAETSHAASEQALDAHGSGVSPHLPQLGQHLVHRLSVLPLDHRHPHRPVARPELLALEPPQAIGQVAQSPPRARLTNGSGETSITARSMPRARRSASAASMRASASGESATTSACGGSVRAGITATSRQA